MFFTLLFIILSINQSFAENLSHNQAISTKSNQITEKFKQVKPKVRSENNIDGITTKFKTNEKEIALTFDACHGKVDWDLINYLQEYQIPATFFWTSSWIRKNTDAAKTIAKNPLFDIQNHGFAHKPCFVDEGSIYGIMSPKGGVQGVIKEIEKGNSAIEQITGKKTKFYRSGTAYYDDVCVEITKELGYGIAGFSILGDGGSTYSRSKVKKALLSAKQGDIIILHMNHPESETAEGVIEALPILKQKGFKFVFLKDVTLE